MAFHGDFLVECHVTYGAGERSQSRVDRQVLLQVVLVVVPAEHLAALRAGRAPDDVNRLATARRCSGHNAGDSGGRRTATVHGRRRGDVNFPDTARGVNRGGR